MTALQSLTPIRIGWAIGDKDEPELRAASALIRLLVKQGSCDVTPFHIAGSWHEDPAMTLRTIAKESGVDSLAEVHLVKTRGEPPDAISSHAERRGLDLIVVGTHARSGLERLFSGSVAESLAMTAKVPLLVVNKDFVPPDRLKRIEFATDLRGDDTPDFLRILPFAKVLGVTLTVYNKIGYLAGDRVKAYREDPIYRQNLQDDVERRRRQLEVYRDIAAASQITCDIVVDQNEGLAIDALCARARGDGTIMAILSKRGPLMATLEPSVTKTLLRRSRCPVWVARATR